MARSAGLPAIFPLAAVVTLIGIGALAMARRRPIAALEIRAAAGKP